MSRAIPSAARTIRTSISKIFKLPPGVYGFGDPCYLFGTRSALSDELWGEVCEVFGGGQCGEVELTDPQGWFIWGTTAMGDGVYQVTYEGVDRKVGVDAGLLGLVPWGLVEAAASDVAVCYAKIETTCDLVVAYQNGDWFRQQYNGPIICRTSADNE